MDYEGDDPIYPGYPLQFQDRPSPEIRRVSSKTRRVPGHIMRLSSSLCFETQVYIVFVWENQVSYMQTTVNQFCEESNVLH